jgi:mannose-1-phosphate guanylyltransferase/phosphomannomutase
VHAQARVEEGAMLEGPFYVGPGCRLAAGAHVGPDAVLTRNVSVKAGARVSDSVVWESVSVAESATVEGALLASRVRVGAFARVGAGAVLGEGSVVSDHSRTG